MPCPRLPYRIILIGPVNRFRFSRLAVVTVRMLNNVNEVGKCSNPMRLPLESLVLIDFLN